MITFNDDGEPYAISTAEFRKKQEMKDKEMKMEGSANVVSNKKVVDKSLVLIKSKID